MTLYNNFLLKRGVGLFSGVGLISGDYGSETAFSGFMLGLDRYMGCLQGCAVTKVAKMF